MRHRFAPWHTSFLTGLLALLFTATLSFLAMAQTPPTTPKANPAPKRSAAKSSNLKTGEITAIDATAETLTLKSLSGQTTTYSLSEKIKCLKNRQEAQISDFKAGDKVVARLRKSRSAEAPSVVELMDAESARWLRGLRGKTLAGTLVELSDEGFVLAVGTDKISCTFTSKTHWIKSGKEASPADFKAHEKVYVAGRTSTAGSIAASVVSDTAPGAALGKERAAHTLHGVLKAVDATAHQLTLTTPTGDTRALTYNDETEVVQAKKPITVAALKTGQHLSVRLKNDEEGNPIVSHITVQTGSRKTTRSVKSSAAPTSAMPAGSDIKK